MYVLKGMIDAYKAADGWNDFTNFQEMEITGIRFPSREARRIQKGWTFPKNGEPNLFYALPAADGKLFRAAVLFYFAEPVFTRNVMLRNADFLHPRAGFHGFEPRGVEALACVIVPYP